MLDVRPWTIILIDGVDVLETQPRKPHPSAGDAAPSRFIPVNPLDLLPPDSAALLPTAVPKQAMIGICDCGEAGCGSLWIQVRRHGGVVVWEPDPRPPRSTVDTTWTFDLRRYLDAVDDAQRSIAAWETRAQRLARELRQRRDGLFPFLVVDPEERRPMRLLDVGAFYGSDEILISLATRNGVRQALIPVPEDRTDEQVILSLHLFNPERFI